MKKLLILIWVGIVPTLNSQTLFKDTYLVKGQSLVNSYRFVEENGIPTDSLVCYYSFNGNANDASGNGYNLTEIGTGITYSNNELNLPGTTDTYLERQDNTVFYGDGYTWNFWFSTDIDLSSIIKVLVDQWIISNGVSIGISSGNFVIFSGSSVNPTVSYALNPSINTDYMATITIQNDFIELFINSVSVDSYTGTSLIDLSSTTNNFRIGRSYYGTAREWEGTIGKVRIYNKILTVGEITALYNE